MYSILGKKQKFIVKPRNSLSHTIEYDMDDLINKYGIIWKNPKSYVDNVNENRIKYYIDDTGYDYDDSFSIASLTRLLVDMRNNFV